jgi:hypothetical protein
MGLFLRFAQHVATMIDDAGGPLDLAARCEAF